VNSDVILQTERLTVHPFELTDGPLLRELHADPLVDRHLVPGDRIGPDEDVAARLAAYVEDQDHHGFSQWKLLDKNGAFVGRAGFTIFERTSEISLSICLKRSFRGLGFAAELVPNLTDWFFDNTYYTHLISFVAAGDATLRRTMEQKGYLLRERLVIDGSAFDCLQVLTPAIASRFPVMAEAS